MTEIDLCLATQAGIPRCCTIYNEEEHKIMTYYIVDCGIDKMREALSKNLPSFMMPNQWIKVTEFSLTLNGKIARSKPREYNNEKYK